MSYAITLGETRRVVDANGVQLTTATCDVASFDATKVRLDFDPDSGALTVTGLAAGQGDVSIAAKGGVPVTHTVTVSVPPFDWSIGDPA